MKKAFTLVVLIVAPTMAFAQGVITIANQTGAVKQWTGYSLINVPRSGGYVELIAAPKGTSLTPLFTDTGTFGFLNYLSFSAFLAANPGWAVPYGNANPGSIGLGPGLFANGNATISNIAAGAPADYILLGWTGPATTVDAAIAAGLAGQALFGESAIATTQTGDPTMTPPELPVSLKTTFPGMALVPIIPEPTTVLLAGLGALLLLLFRRRA